MGKAGASFRFLSTLLASIAEFERELIRERTGEGRMLQQRAAGIWDNTEAG
jgi:DNA invertase Pin-like site-specific DNA recombinase